MTTAFGPIRWAKSVPTIRRANGRVDSTAHHVLLVLATYAKRDGTDARPGLDLLADDCYLTPAAVADALDRIKGAGLISEAANLTGGTTVWRLHLEIANDGPSRVDEHVEQRRIADRERQRRHRQRQAEERSRHGMADRDSHGPVERDVTVSDGVTVTVPDTVSHGVGDRESRSLTPLVTVSQALHPQVSPATTAIELPIELPIELTPPPAVDINASFDAFWTAYPRKVGKGQARTAWAKAIKAADPATITAAATRYATERAGADPKYTPHPATWLNGERWTDEPGRPQLRVVGNHQPWDGYADQSVYDEDI